MEQPAGNHLPPDALIEVVSRHWGYDSLRPLQRQAMESVLARRDSLLVVPTGGGKSLCYQAPALLAEGLTIVVSPLISLMKDQVDSLHECGVSAAQLNSSLPATEQRAVEQMVSQGKTRLLFVSPERLAMSSFRDLLQRSNVSSFAIDEAHCISHWGHDFRPEYRQLRQLCTLYPNASLHAYTATATEKVRRDIIEQLGLRNPLIMVGEMDRPNLTYKILPRRDSIRQIEEILKSHAGEAGIVYCIRRKEVDETAAELKRRGHKAVPYHAGMTPDERRQMQESFASEASDLVVATVAFGMGIDRSNVRFVIHTGMPKSIEHYQQETGRAGRDGLEAECVLLYSPGDGQLWKSIMEKGATEENPEHLAMAFAQIDLMDRFCSASICRHKSLVKHFGGTYEPASCGACDVCLGEFVVVPDALQLAQKILSCVVRLKTPFGASYLISVLRGENLRKITERNHDSLSTFGLLRSYPKEELRDFIGQLAASGFLRVEGDVYPVIRLTADSGSVLKGETVPLLRAQAQTTESQMSSPQRKSSADRTGDWEGVDRNLFEELRKWRKETAAEKSVPSFVIFGDRTLRALAAIRPTTLASMNAVYGIGDAKLQEYGPAIVELISTWCSEAEVSVNQAGQQSSELRKPVKQSGGGWTGQAGAASKAFAAGASIDEVVESTGRTRQTVIDYLCRHIEATDAPIERWVDADTIARVTTAAAEAGLARLRPIRDLTGDDVSWDEIRIVLARLNSAI